MDNFDEKRRSLSAIVYAAILERDMKHSANPFEGKWNQGQQMERLIEVLQFTDALDVLDEVL